MNKVFVLFNGYSKIVPNDPRGEVMKANCSCTLIQCANGQNIIIDSMDPWSNKKLREALDENKINPTSINFCISTHTHPDHMGNNNLFLEAMHIVGHTISKNDEYFAFDFTKNSYRINEDVEIVSTKGHTQTCVTLICRNTEIGTIAVVGDLFEHENDVEQPKLWMSAGSEAPEYQKLNRYKIAMVADYIVPGHGPMFKVTEKIRQQLRNYVPAELL